MEVRGVDPAVKEYKGKNSLSTLALFYYRSLYSVTFTEGGLRDVSKSVTNFEYGERIFYGRVNHDMAPIMPRESFMSVITSQRGDKVCKVMNFVAKAFEDFQNAFFEAGEKKQISLDEGFMSTPSPMKGYKSAVASYGEYRIALFELFIEKIRSDKEKSYQIKDFESFVPHLDSFIEEVATVAPFTFSAYMRSKYASPHSSGLVIDLAEMNASKDAKKVARVYDNPNYPFYENMAMQFGFSIDKNVPYRLIADLNSPAMKRYMKHFNFNNYVELFRTAYEVACIKDYNVFKSLYTSYYNSYVQFNQSTAIPKMKKDGKYIPKRIFRERIDLISLNVEYGEKWFLEKYITIRNMEEGMKYTPERMMQIADRAHRISKVRGKASGLLLIDKQFRDVSHLAGSVNQTQKALEKRQESRSTTGTRQGIRSYYS